MSEEGADLALEGPAASVFLPLFHSFAAKAESNLGHKEISTAPSWKRPGDPH